MEERNINDSTKHRSNRVQEEKKSGSEQRKEITLVTPDTTTWPKKLGRKIKNALKKMPKSEAPSKHRPEQVEAEIISEASQANLDLTKIPKEASYPLILKRLTLPELLALRQVSPPYKAYIDGYFNKNHWQIEFPKALPQPNLKFFQNYPSFYREHYAPPLYSLNPSHPLFDTLDSFFCGNYFQFFENLKSLSVEEKYACLHPGFSIGFALFRHAKTRDSKDLLLELSELASKAGADFLYGTQAIKKRSLFRKEQKKASFETYLKACPVEKALETDNFQLIADAIETLSTEDKLNFLVGMQGKNQHLLSYLLKKSKTKLSMDLINYVESLCESTPSCSHLLKPKGLIKLRTTIIQPLFSCVAAGENAEFKARFNQLGFEEQCGVLSYYRSDGMSLAMLAAYNGNLDLLICLNNFVEEHKEECQHKMNTLTLFGDEPLIEAWNAGHTHCVQHLLKNFPGILSKESYYTSLWENLRPSAISHYRLSETVLNHYVRTSMVARVEISLAPVLLKILRAQDKILLDAIVSLFPIFEHNSHATFLGPIVPWETLLRDYYETCLSQNDQKALEWMSKLSYFQDPNSNETCKVSEMPPIPSPRRFG